MKVLSISIMFCMLKLPEKGFFVEVGAFDGESNSFTVDLADNGWEGVYVEPVPKFFDKCKQRHARNNVQCINAAVGEQIGELKLYEYGQITTSRDDIKALWDSNDMRKFIEKPLWGEVTVPMVTLDSIVGERQIDLLVVDVEGMEWEVLSTLKTKPKQVIIELHEKSEDWKIIKLDSRIEEFFKEYTKVHSDDINTFYVL